LEILLIIPKGRNMEVVQNKSEVEVKETAEQIYRPHQSQNLNVCADGDKECLARWIAASSDCTD